MGGAPRCTVVVHILGQEYRVEGEGDPARIAAMAQYVDGKMRELSPEASPTPSARMGVLAALNIAEELFRERDLRREQEEGLEARLGALAEALARETG